MAFKNLCDEAKELLRQRASNYDGTSAEDLYDLLPDDIKGNSKAIILFMKGCPELGIEPAEVMHIQSEANGGSDDPSNLMWGPRSINRRIGSDDMTPADIEEVNEANQENIKTILDNIDVVDVPTDCDEECPESDELHEFLPQDEAPTETDELKKLIEEAGDFGLDDIPLISSIPILGLGITAIASYQLLKKDNPTAADKVRMMELSWRLTGGPFGMTMNSRDLRRARRARFIKSLLRIK